VLALVDFFWFRGFVAEVRKWMDQFLAIEMPNSPLHALLLQKAGWYARVSGDFKRADFLLHRALEMAKEIGDDNRVAWAQMDLGLSTRDQGNHEQSIVYFDEALTYAQASGEVRAIANCLYFLAESSSEGLDRAQAMGSGG
jgi:tetratricopeptide (TPR) repeat protein